MELTKIILEEDEIPLIRTKNFEKISYVKGYHAYKDLWIPVKGEYLRCEREPDNVMDKYAVCVKKENVIVRHLLLGKSGKFAKTISYFLRVDELNSCHLVVTGKHVNLGDGDDMQVPCKLHFAGLEGCIEKLQGILS